MATWVWKSAVTAGKITFLPHGDLILRSGPLAASRRMSRTPSWFETREAALLTMRPPRSCDQQLRLNPRPRRGLGDIFLGLLERAFQRLRRRHVADLGEMVGDSLG